MREAGSGTRALFEHYLHRHNLQVNIAWEASSPLAIKNAVVYNGGLSVMSIWLFQEEILNGDIHVVCNPYNEWERTFKLVYHKNKFMTSSIEQIRDILKRYRRPDILDYVKSRYPGQYSGASDSSQMNRRLHCRLITKKFVTV